MTTNQIIICVVAVVIIAVIVSVLMWLIKSGILQNILQKFYQHIKGTQGFKTFKRVMFVLLGVLITLVIGYFIYTAVQL